MVGEKQVPLLDLRAQHGTIRGEVLDAVTRLIDSQKFILGEEVQKLEQELAPYCGAGHAIGCASGSDALFLALLAAGVGPGAEVLTTPYTFFATAGAIHRTGATPVFVDVDGETFNMDMAQASETLARREKIRAVIPIHLFGACADMDPLLEAVSGRQICVIEDAAQSIGSEYKGRRAGGIGHIACFSFFPSKNLGCYGDGGLLTTNDPALAEQLACLRVHGARKKYVHEFIGINSRLDALQAAVLRVKFRYLDSWTEGRRRHAEQYREMLAGTPAPVRVPRPALHTTRHVYNQFAIRCERRDQLQVWLKQHGIGSEVYYPIPLHLQKCFEHLGYRAGSFPVSERLAQESLALPVHAELPAEDIGYICETIQSFYGT